MLDSLGKANKIGQLCSARVRREDMSNAVSHKVAGDKPVGPNTNINCSRSATMPLPTSNIPSGTTSASGIVGHCVLLVVLMFF
jgi:hypothetical protein